MHKEEQQLHNWSGRSCRTKPDKQRKRKIISVCGVTFLAVFVTGEGTIRNKNTANSQTDMPVDAAAVLRKCTSPFSLFVYHHQGWAALDLVSLAHITVGALSSLQAHWPNSFWEIIFAQHSNALSWILLHMLITLVGLHCFLLLSPKPKCARRGQTWKCVVNVRTGILRW